MADVIQVTGRSSPIKRTLLLLLSLCAGAECAGDDAWDSSLARGATRTIRFETDEATIQALHVSPDGRWVVFDALGHVYRVPTAGGDAENLTADSGIALNFDPRYSPGGELIAFISDRSGQNSLWVMDPDGGNQRVVAEGGESWIVEPAWAADGQSIFAVRRYIPSYARTGDWAISTKLWQFPLADGPAAEVIGGDRTYVSAPSASPDGRYVYYAIEDEPSNADGYFMAGDRHHIRRKDLVSGDDLAVTSAASRRAYWQTPFHSTAPEISPDGTLLAFVRRVPFEATEFRDRSYGYSTGLWLHDLRSGEERLLTSPITPDHFETFSGYHQRYVPGYGWSADSETIVYTEGGKIRRVDVSTGEVSTIPFVAKVDREISERIRPKFRIEGSEFRSRFLMRPATNADFGITAFDAAGGIWLANGDGTDARPMNTPGTGKAYAFSLSWSPDNRLAAFTTWEDGVGGHLWTVPAQDGVAARVSSRPAEYLNPVWSTDGREIVVVRGTGAALRGEAVNDNQIFELVRFDIPAQDAAGTVIARIAGPMHPVMRPHFGPGNRLYFLEGTAAGNYSGLASGDRPDMPASALVSISTDGSDKREHARFVAAEDAAISPGGNYVAFREGKNVYIATLNRDDTVPFLPTESAAVSRLTSSGGQHPHWIDARTLEFVNGNTLHRYDVSSEQRTARSLHVNVPRRMPTSRIAFVGARIISMRDRDNVIERGDVVVENGRIQCVGACSHDRHTKTIDASGKTIIPGLFDAHCHPGWDADVLRQRNPGVAVYLAYGITTCFEPAASEFAVFPAAELIEAGRMVGPRILSTGPVVFPDVGSLSVSSRTDAAQTAEALASWGAVSVKQYTLPRRDQRQWLAAAVLRSGRLGMTGEGLDLYYNLGMVMDGQSGFEHPITALPVYRDVVEFMARSGANYTPAFQASGQGLYASEYWRTRFDIYDNEKYRRWVPWQKVGRFASYNRRPVEAYPIPLWAESVRDLFDAGASVSVGAHSREDGIGVHWELWTFAMALEPLEALSTATIYPARYLGFERDLGSIEAGKIADLLILNANPLEDIQATVDIAYVMASGILYDDDTLDQVWPTYETYGPRAWTIQDRAGR